MKKILILTATSCCVVAMSNTARADWSLTAKAVSDYTFNGVSQTQGDPALQVSVDWAGKNGLYAGAWTSNVDFGQADKTSNELDFYIGKYWQLNDKVGLDAGLAYYTYHGAPFSDDYNYPEAYAKLGFNSSLGDSELNFWYTNDYFGTEGDHHILQLAHKFNVGDGKNIRLSYARSNSGDTNKWSWGGTDGKYYDHFRAEYITSWKGLDLNVAIEDTSNIDNGFDADSRAVFSVGKSFNF